jgi:L-ribulose-5-phosphate 4-epimerase
MHNLVIFTEGNVSAITEDRKKVLIKPSGVPYDQLTPDKVVVTDMEGRVIEGSLKPSVDLPTHLEIYRNFKEIKSIVHTHSVHATVFAQLKKPIVCSGTTQADAFYGDIPVTRLLTDKEIESDYEKNIGKSVCEILDQDIPAVLVASHGPFVFGKNPADAVKNAAILEKVAKMAILSKESPRIQKALLDKHYLRKHGAKKYYGN